MRARRRFGFVLVSTLALLLSSGACGRQGEGERCDLNSESEDCESNLVCTAGDQLTLGGVDRCCPPPDTTPTDARCFPSSGAGGTGGSDAGVGGAAGTSGVGGSPDASEAASEAAGGGAGGGCSYNSECPDGLVCGPAGRCQAECQVDRDCRSGETCVSGKCTAPPDASVD